ncbi:MAG: hypothetical protein NUV57_05870, partial [archaeon]|nr:hypothetical protein [archaeon]
WKYKNPQSKTRIFVAANKEGKILAHSAGITRKIRIGDSEYIALKVEDLKVEKESRGKGIFSGLSDYCKGIGKEEDFLFYGFPDKKMKKIGVEKLKYTCRGAISNYVKVLYKPQKKAEEDIVMMPTNKFGDEIEEIWGKFSKKHSTVLERNHKDLNWRFTQKPNSNYDLFIAYKKKEPAGYMVAEKTGLKIGIVDLVTSEKNTITAMINNVINHYSTEPRLYMTGYFSDQTTISELNKMGFFRVPFGKAHLVTSICPKNADKNLLGVNSWFLTKADIEL